MWICTQNLINHPTSFIPASNRVLQCIIVISVVYNCTTVVYYTILFICNIASSKYCYSEKAMAPHSVLLPGKSHGCRKAAVHGVSEGWIRLSIFTFTFHFHALEKGMATHSSVLAWRIPGTEKHGRLPSMGHTESETTEVT